MSGPLKAVLDVLARHGDIEWARCVGRLEPLRAPFVAWRYKTPDEGMEQRIVEAVRSYAGLVRWVAVKGERNWVIQPDAFRTFSRNFDTEVRQCNALARSSPRKPRRRSRMPRTLRRISRKSWRALRSPRTRQLDRSGSADIAPCPTMLAAPTVPAISAPSRSELCVSVG
jgi:hypothetical protein